MKEETLREMLKRLVIHLEQKWGDQSCPLCENDNWNVSDSIYKLQGSVGQNVIFGNVPIIPVVPVTCTNCGNTILVNTIVAGVTKPEGRN